MSQNFDTRAFLKSLVDLGSPTTEQKNVRHAHSVLSEKLESLGFKTEWIPDPSGKTTELMVAERAGLKDSWITMVSHIDTVLGPSDAGEFRVQKNAKGQDCALGAGIIDNKGGLAVLVASLAEFLRLNPKHECGFRVVSSPDEENGSAAWHKVFADIGKRSNAVLGFEPALDDGSVIWSRRGNRWYDVTFTGIEAHAGRCQGEEINAAHEAARVVTRLLELRDKLRAKYGNGVSLHVGHIEGGRDRHNVVCGEVIVKVDTRFASFEERDAIHEGVTAVLRSPQERNLEGKTTKIDFKIIDDCPPFDVNASTKTLVESLCKKIASLEGRAIAPAKAGGAGDVNHMSRPGLFVVDGLGPVGGGMHTVHEFVELRTLETRAQALASWYRELIAGI